MASTLPREFEVVEAATTKVSLTLTDESGVDPVPASILTTLTLRILASDADATVLVPSRAILNTGGGTVDECGQVIARLDPSDMTMQDATLPWERHLIQFTWTWGTPTRTGYYEIALILRNLTGLP